MIDKELLDILVCPLCKVAVRLESDKLICAECGRKYPIEDGIPIMLPEEAQSSGSNDGKGKVKAV